MDEKPTNNFRRVSWNEALDLIVSKLKDVLNRYGSKSVLHLDYSGNMGLLTRYYPHRLWRAIGATKTDYSICSKSGHDAISLHYGLSYGILPDDITNMKLVVYWGFNPISSSPHMWNLSLKARRHGARIVVIDPRRSESAKSADMWINVKPSTDVALAYGIARCLIEKGYVDNNFIENWTYGYEYYAREAVKWSIDKVEKITGVRWNLIEEFSDLYGKFKPNVIMIGFGGQRTIYGHESVRGTVLLPALIGLHRGFYYSNSRGYLINLSYLNGEAFAGKSSFVVNMVTLGDYVERGKFKFIYIYNMNPALTLPNQKSFRRGLMRPDVFVVVHDTHWNETMKYADVVLPASTYLEKDDVIISYSHNYVRFSRGIIKPLGESKDEVWVTQEIARRIGLTYNWLYENPYEALRNTFKDSFHGGSFFDLLNGKMLRLKRRALNEYQTQTGKIEFYSLDAEDLGINPLPEQFSIVLNVDEFILLNSSTRMYTHTQFWDIYGPPEPIVMMNSEDARKLDINEGEIIKLYNSYGEIYVKVIISNNVQQKTLWVPHQLIDMKGNPLNDLILPKAQRIGGGSAFNSTTVKISKT